MLVKYCLKYSLILSLIFFSVLKGSLYANNTSQIKTQENEILKVDFLNDAKGTVGAVPEVCNGGAFQFNIFKLKNQFSSNASFSVGQNAARTLITYLLIKSGKAAKIPCYLFNRRILI
jgi:hypothetical protein